ncbi:MAG: hypothetical protein ACRELE_09005 [Gemmatimonadales bacterium]
MGFGLWALGSGLLLTGCYPTTTRPAFLPEASAPIAEIELAVPQATRAAALALNADSIPIRRTEPKDGWLESEWFDATTLRPTNRRRLGPDVVKVRAWIDPSRPNFSNVTIETVYRPLADPSRTDRELERQVPVNHRVEGKVLVALGELRKAYGGVPADTVAPAIPAKRGMGKPLADSTARSRPPIKPPL